MQLRSRLMNLLSVAKQNIKEIDAPAVKAKLEAKESIYLIDVRETKELEAGYVPGAIHISKGHIECQIEQLTTDTNAEIILYCQAGVRAALAADSLTKMGYENVSSMAGGYNAWLEAGFSV